MSGLRTEFDFVLPKGYVDGEGRLHRDGRNRLATAREERESLRDRPSTDSDHPYLTVLVLALVVTALGSLAAVTDEVVEGLFAVDLAFLQDLYGIVNFGTDAEITEVMEQQQRALADLDVVASSAS